MFKFKIEAIHKGVTHKGFWSFSNSRVETVCGKTLAEGTYRDRNALVLYNADCSDCLSKR
ncbi:hypothetical protein GCM10027597_44520 [Saccharopolyspora tripterygii]